MSVLLARRTADLLARLLSKQRRGFDHVQACRIGQWVNGYGAPDGAPCSELCVEVRALHALWQAEAERTEVRQLEMAS